VVYRGEGEDRLSKDEYDQLLLICYGIIKIKELRTKSKMEVCFIKRYEETQVRDYNNMLVLKWKEGSDAMIARSIQDIVR
jgi:hypothetical protein